jgi:hypothetical protein
MRYGLWVTVFVLSHGGRNHSEMNTSPLQPRSHKNYQMKGGERGSRLDRRMLGRPSVTLSPKKNQDSSGSFGCWPVEQCGKMLADTRPRR